MVQKKMGFHVSTVYADAYNEWRNRHREELEEAGAAGISETVEGLLTELL